MGKRSNENTVRPKDFWPTVDPACIPPAMEKDLYGHTYYEPCVGNGDLVEHLKKVGAICVGSSDVREIEGVRQLDALKLKDYHLNNPDYILTNPPFSWELLQPLLYYLPTLAPTWLLLPADFMHNVQDCQANCLRTGRVKDELQRDTVPL